MGVLMAWIRGNPITVGSAVVALCSVVLLFVVGSQGRDFEKRMGESDRLIRQIKMLGQTPVRIPSADPNQPEEHHSIAINQAAIDTLTQAYDRMDGEYREIFELAVGVNQHHHEPMVEGLFPRPESDYKPFDAKGKYRRAFQVMLGPWGSGQSGPRLDAGVPLVKQKLDVEVGLATAEFLESFFPPRAIDQLTDQEQDELKGLRARKVIEALQAHAGSIHLYVKTTDIDDRGFPFEVDAWSQGDRRPDMREVWEGQVGLWIQQDIVEAIARANRVDDPRSNVMNAAVKQLLGIHIEPQGRYLGAERLRKRHAGPVTRRVRVAGRVQTQVVEAAPTSRAGSAADERLPYDFSTSATGRTGNDLYDVWHVEVRMVVDWRKLPELLRHLQQVNFMTVLRVDISGVDEYEALARGMVFGSGDAVEVDMLIESIWLREWTMALMPQQVREHLGIRP